jgi:predicted transcriptional regulator
MSDKEVVLETLKRLPEAASLEEISEAIAILAAIRRGEADARDGRILSHADLKQRSTAWTTK